MSLFAFALAKLKQIFEIPNKLSFFLIKTYLFVSECLKILFYVKYRYVLYF